MSYRPPDGQSRISHPSPPPTAILENKGQVCSTLESEQMAEQRRRLASAWNLSLPVNKLPTELLVMIFTLLKEPFLPFPYPDVEGIMMAWMKLMLVCRHWRDVACTTPLLWRQITIGKAASWTELALVRSAGATIDVLMSAQHFSLQNLVLLRSNAHRIRHLHFRIDVGFWLLPVRDFLQGDMPTLETLDLRSEKELTLNGLEVHQLRHRSIRLLEPRINRQRFPRLKSLQMLWMAAPSDVSLYPQLRTLSLTACSCLFTFDQFLDILAVCKNLEQLELSAFLPFLAGDWMTAPVPRRPPLSLPRLKELSLTGHSPLQTSCFLSHLLLSSTDTSVLVQADLCDDSDDDIEDTIPALLPPNSRTVLPALPKVTFVGLEVSYADYKLYGGRPGDHLVEFSIVSAAIREHHERLLWRGLDDLQHIYSGAPLTDLRIEESEFTPIHADRWHNLLDAFPLLELLTIGAYGDCSELLVALELPPNSLDAPVVCPHLTEIYMEIWEGYGQAFSALLGCLQHRMEVGVPLQKITVGLTGGPGGEWQYPCFETAYLPQLRELVPRFTYWEA